MVTDCETVGPLGPALKDQWPEVLDYVRFYNNTGIEISMGDNIFFENRVYYTDPSALTIFNYDFIQGEAKGALDRPFTAILTASMARKYFDRTDIVGESIEVISEWDNERLTYEVTAIIEDIKPNTHFKFDFLLSHSTLNHWDYFEEESWGSNNEYTYLLVTPNTDFTAFNQKLLEFSREMKEKLGDDRWTADRLNEIHLYSHKTFEPEVNGDADTVYFLGIIAIITILIAWVNYVNLSTARAIERAREVGVRKVIGSTKVQLTFQFLFEAFIINLLGSLLAVTMMQMSLPLFRELTGQPLPGISMNDPFYLGLIAALVLVGTLISGLYPALVLSSFKPVVVLKGRFSRSSKGQVLRKGLSLFQFTATVVLIAGTVAVYLQVNHLRTADIGMNIDQMLVIKAPRLAVEGKEFAARYTSFSNELTQNPAITNVTRSGGVPGANLSDISTTSYVVRDGQDISGSYTYYHFRVDTNFFKTYGVKLLAGSNFKIADKRGEAVIINKEAMRTLGFANPEEAVQNRIKFNGNFKPEVVGVVESFRHVSPKEPHLPMIFHPGGDVYFSISLKTENIQTSIDHIEKAYQKMFPDKPFSYYFLDEQYDQQYRGDVQFAGVSGVFTILTIFIACLGLFGLTSFTVLQRTKEIGVRKVLGASVMNVVKLLSSDFIRLVVVASILAVPISYYVIQRWLDSYASRIEIEWWLFILPFFLVFFIAMLTVSFQTVRAASANPVDSLRYE